MIGGILIVLIVLLYWKFFYFNHRNDKTSQFYLLVPAVIACLIGILYSFKIDIIPKNIYAIFLILCLYNTLGMINIAIALKKHKLIPKVDYTLTWIKRTLGIFWLYVAIIISYPALFFIVLGTYRILGGEHIYLWIMILLAWSVSGIKLFMNYVLK